MTPAVSDRDLDRPAAAALAADAPPPAGGAETPVNVAWAGRLFALLCAGAGTYVAIVSIVAIQGGQAAATWLLPLVTGGLSAVLCAGILPASATAFLSRRSIGMRTLAIVLLILYAFVLLPALGFLLASLLFATVVAIVYAPRRLAVGLGSAIVTVALWALFAYVVAEPLPVGSLWR